MLDHQSLACPAAAALIQIVSIVCVLSISLLAKRRLSALATTSNIWCLSSQLRPLNSGHSSSGVPLCHASNAVQPSICVWFIRCCICSEGVAYF